MVASPVGQELRELLRYSGVLARPAGGRQVARTAAVNAGNPKHWSRS
jgi:hypothetical protein